MIFSELRFLAFFGLVFLVHWGLGSARARKLWLLAASYAFYAAWDWRFLGLILLSTAVDFVAGAGVERGTHRRAWLALSLGVNLGLLGFFKYFNFFVESAASLGQLLGLQVNDHTLAIILPVGISFYTFQTLSYTIDIYRGRLEATKSPLDFALFVAFFPQLVAGPIVRAVDFLPQLKTQRSFERVDVRAALLIFLFGFIKKTCVADHLSVAVDEIWRDPGSFSVGSHWLGAVLYQIQLYCDFSGYSEMAIGSAALLGYRLPVNFAFPYFARSLAGLWRRWHITMTGWFRDYIYFPLGGSRLGSARTLGNILLVFLVTGIWHGAGWTFVLFGLLQGALVVVERSVLGSSEERLSRVFVLWANGIWVVSLILFRAPSLAQAGSYYEGLVSSSGTHVLSSAWLVLIVGFFLVHALMRTGRIDRGLRALSPATFAVALGILVALILPFAAGNVQPFVYFQF